MTRKPLVVTVMTLLLTAGSLGPVAEGAENSGVVAFVSDRDGSRQIYTVRSDGRGLKGPLTNIEDDIVSNPDVSPDGKRITFSAYKATCAAVDCIIESHVWVMASDGSQLTQLTDLPGTNDWEPTWTADGRSIVFHRTSSAVPEWGDLYRLTETSPGAWEEEVFLSRPGAEYSLEFSPDGRWLAYTYVTDDDPYYNAGEDDYILENGDIVIARADGTRGRRLRLPASEEADPSWSPDSKKLSFTRWRIMPEWDAIGVWTVDRDGTHVKQVLRGPEAADATWTADGRALLYQHCAGDGFTPDRCAIGRYNFATGRRSVFHDAGGFYDGQPDIGGAR